MDDLIQAIKVKSAEFRSVLVRESDRGAILIVASHLDDGLEEAIKGSFNARVEKPSALIKPLFQTFGPLATLAAKSRLAYAVDAIPKWMYEDIETIRRIRNFAAHSISVFSFEQPEVLQLVACMSAPKLASIYMGNRDEQKTETEDIKGRKESPFSVLAAQLRAIKPAVNVKNTNIKYDYNPSDGRTTFIDGVCCIVGFLMSNMVVQRSDIPEEFKRGFIARVAPEVPE